MEIDQVPNTHEEAPVPSSKMARAFTPWLGAALAIIGIIWASGIVVDLGIALITEQVICGVLGLTFAIIFLNIRAGNQRLSYLPWYDAVLALVGFVIDGDVYLRDGDSGIVYASERDASTGELVPVGRWVDGALVPLASAPGWISADGGERVIVQHF